MKKSDTSSKSATKRLWFKAKLFGWGWYPATWQGWLILGGYLLLVFLDFKWRDGMSHSNSDTVIFFVPETLVLTAILIWICWKTGEKPRWRWGK